MSYPDTSSPLRPTSMTINLDRLISNYSTLKRLAGAASVMAVLKANAYGHGLIQCAQSLEKRANVDAIGVALVEEGVKLRQAGIKAPILVFGGLFNDQVSIYLKHDLALTASSVEKLQLINAVAGSQNTRAKVHLKIDTGMGRIGVRPESAVALFEEVTRCTHCDVQGVFTHYAMSDEQDLSFTQHQFDRFSEVCVQFRRILGTEVAQKHKTIFHAANSGALLQFPQGNLDMVRSGIALFGVSPSAHLEPALAQVGLQPVMEVRSRVVYFKVVRAGESVSYGRTWIAPEQSRVVTVPIGYGDGYSRALSNRASVLIHGKRYPVVGRVCMDQILVNIAQGEAYNGDEVVLVGTQGNETISVNDIASWAGTIGYEVLTALNLRIPREYILDGHVIASEIEPLS